jgi:hypothetical protein
MREVIIIKIQYAVGWHITSNVQILYIIKLFFSFEFKQQQNALSKSNLNCDLSLDLRKTVIATFLFYALLKKCRQIFLTYLVNLKEIGCKCKTFSPISCVRKLFLIQIYD